MIVRSMGRHLTTGSLRFLFANLQAHSPGMCVLEKGYGYLYEAEVGLYLPDGVSQLQIHRISATVFVLGALIGSCRACLLDIVPSWRQIRRLGLPRPPSFGSRRYMFSIIAAPDSARGGEKAEIRGRLHNCRW